MPCAELGDFICIFGNLEEFANSNDYNLRIQNKINFNYSDSKKNEINSFMTKSA